MRQTLQTSVRVSNAFYTLSKCKVVFVMFALNAYRLLQQMKSLSPVSVPVGRRGSGRPYRWEWSGPGAFAGSVSGSVFIFIFLDWMVLLL